MIGFQYSFSIDETENALRHMKNDYYCTTENKRNNGAEKKNIVTPLKKRNNVAQKYTTLLNNLIARVDSSSWYFVLYFLS